MSVQVYIGLGSNLDDPLQQIQTALVELRELALNHDVTCSPVYLTRPLGPQDQPDYYNACAGFETALGAITLLECLQEIETRHRRQRSQEQWGPRTLDLDLLLYGDEMIESDILTVPHPRIQERAFVLKPLADIAPGLEIRGQGRVNLLLQNSDHSSIKERVSNAG